MAQVLTEVSDRFVKAPVISRSTVDLPFSYKLYFQMEQVQHEFNIFDNLYL